MNELKTRHKIIFHVNLSLLLLAVAVTLFCFVPSRAFAVDQTTVALSSDVTTSDPQVSAPSTNLDGSNTSSPADETTTAPTDPVSENIDPSLSAGSVDQTTSSQDLSPVPEAPVVASSNAPTDNPSAVTTTASAEPGSLTLSATNISASPISQSTTTATTTSTTPRDTTPPKVSVKRQTTCSHCPKLVGRVDDKQAKVYVLINGHKFSATNKRDGTWELANQKLMPDNWYGQIDVKVWAVDAKGNVGRDNTTNELTIISCAPVVSTWNYYNASTYNPWSDSTSTPTIVYGQTEKSDSEMSKTTDSDGDGYPDYDETKAGTDPLDKNSHPEDKEKPHKPQQTNDPDVGGLTQPLSTNVEQILFAAAVACFLWFIIRKQDN